MNGFMRQCFSFYIMNALDLLNFQRSCVNMQDDNFDLAFCYWLIMLKNTAAPIETSSFVC